MAGKCRKVCQVFVGVFIFIVMLIALVLNKVTLIWLLGGTRITSFSLETWYAAFALVLIVPEAVGVMKVLWNTSFIKRTKAHQWPSGIALFVGLLVSFAEVSSFLVFTLEVAPRLPVPILLPLLSAVFAVSLCYEQWESYRYTRLKRPQVKYDNNFTLTQRNGCKDDDSGHSHHEPPRERNWKRVIKTVLGFSGVWSSCAIAGIVALTSSLPWFQALCLPACLCLLSLAWCPKVQMYIVRSPDGSFRGRWKATCLYTVFKLMVLMIGLSIVMVIRLQEHGIVDKNFFLTLYQGLVSCRHNEIFYPLLVHFGSSLMGHALSYVSTALCIPCPGLTLPAILATPASIGLGIYLCSPTFGVLDDLMCLTHGAGIWCAFALSAITWIAPLVIRGRDLNPPSNIILKPFEELFIQPTWNSIFFDQYMWLNYIPYGFSNTDHILKPKPDEISRIFLCTTMYREADVEMGRLLKSLHKVSQSKRLKHVYLEAHIFLDHGTQDLHLTDFATQLVSLLESKMEVAARDANAFMTPYGAQLNWTLPGGMPFFIHLKDTAKVKAKKRWSQVMYMSYVLNFRVMRDHSRDRLPPLALKFTPNVDDSLFVGYASDKEWENNSVSLTSKDNPVPKTPPPGAASASQTPYFVKESRKHLARMISPNTTGHDGQPDSSRSINSLIASLGQELVQSSDQGIGNSDELSVSSLSTKNEDMDSSETATSRKSSFKRRDEGWQDYEGDVSSNNENSLTSMKAKQVTERVKEFINDDKENVIYEHSPTHHKESSTDRPPKQKRGSAHPQHRHHRHRPKKELKQSSSKAQLLQHMKTEYADLELGQINEAFDDSPGQDPARFDYRLPHTDSEIFTVCKKTIPSRHPKKRKDKIPLDDHTYILATDADMEFTDESVLDLLNLCNFDRRIGGACGRTHPIGQKTGPLVWYQKFEYAKDFWMIKSAQNVIGSVMCCPGCFSLYRAGAVRDVVSNYAGPTEKAFDVFIKDTGEDRWMCTLMMLHGWKLEYTAFCDNTTFCPDGFEEFMKQRRRWVLSDLSNMLLVFRSIFKLAKKNDSFSIAYILYMLQLFTIVLLSPASTVVILSGGLDIVYGVPFEIVAPTLGLVTLTYALICIVAGLKTQVRVTLVLTVLLGLMMLLIVIGGSVFVIQDISADAAKGALVFQEYYLILLLIAALIFASFIHPKETWIIGHGMSYLIGFPAMQILLPIYSICNIVDQSWGTRDTNESKSPPVSCFSKNRKKYHKTLSRQARLPSESDLQLDEEEQTVEVEQQPSCSGNEKPVQCSANQFKPMDQGNGHQVEEYMFWLRMREIALGAEVNIGLQGEELARGLRRVRNICLMTLLLLNALWLVLLSVLYFNADFNLAKLNIYGLIAGAVYGLVLYVQVVGMTAHRAHAIFRRFSTRMFGSERPVWIHMRT